MADTDGIEYEVVEETAAYEVGMAKATGEIILACKCGAGAVLPDKPMGQREAEAWRERHADEDVSTHPEN